MTSLNQISSSNAEIENLRMKNEHLQQLLNSQTEIYQKTLELVIRERNDAITEAGVYLERIGRYHAISTALMEERDTIVSDLISSIPSGYRTGILDTYKTKPNISPIQIQRLETAMEESMMVEKERKSLTKKALC